MRPSANRASRIWSSGRENASRRPAMERAIRPVAEALEVRRLLSQFTGEGVPVVTLSIVANSGEWTAYASDSVGDNAGIATFDIDVIGSAGINVAQSFDAAPIGLNGGGFSAFPSNGLQGTESGGIEDPGNGIAIDAGQNLSFGAGAVFQGFGQKAKTEEGVSWNAPAEIAYGTYSGTVGLLTVSADYSIGAGIQTLNGDSAGQWSGPGNISTDVVNDGLTTVGLPAPEISVLDLGNINGVAGVPLNNVQLAVFNDANGPLPASFYSATINWGDGSPATTGLISIVNGQIAVSGSHTYDSDGTYHPTISLTDPLTSANATANVQVGSPVYVAADPITPVQDVTFNGPVATATDVFTNDTPSDVTASIDWGDGTTTTGTVLGTNGGFIIDGQHQYTALGLYTLTVSLTNSAGLTGTDSEVIDVESNALGEYTTSTPQVTAGVPFNNVQLATFSDSGGLFPQSQYSASIDWGDGSTPTTGTVQIVSGLLAVSGSHTYATMGDEYPTVTLTDPISSASAISEVEVGDPFGVSVPNLAISEGQAFNGVVANITDADLSDSIANLSAEIDWGDGVASQGTINGSNGVYTVSGTHTYEIGRAVTVGVTISDSSENTGFGQRQISLVPSTLTAASAATISAMIDVPLTNVQLATFSDSVGVEPVGAYTATINWGDGTSDTSGAVSIVSNSIVVSGSHTYAAGGTFTPSVTLSDASSSAVANPTITLALPISASAIPIIITEGQPFSGNVATVTDIDSSLAASQLSATITWGDGGVSSGVITGGDGAFTVSGSYSYAAAGQLPLSVAVSDSSGNTSTSTTTASVIGGSLSVASVGSISSIAGVSTGVVGLATFSDSNGVQSASSYTASITWNDGTPAVAGSVSIVSGQIVVSGAHTYPLNGTYSPTVMLWETGSLALATPSVAVANPLSISAISVSATAGETAFLSVATLTDANTAENSSQLYATINWGDGTSSSGVVVGSDGEFYIGGVHDYASAGSFALTVTVTDAAGNSISTGDSAIAASGPTQLAFQNGPTSTIAGQAISPAVVVDVEDDAGQIVTTDDSVVTLAVSSGPAGAPLSGTVSVFAVDGVATFSNLRLTEAGQYALRATDGDLTTAVSSLFSITPANVSALSFVQQPTGTATGAAIQPAVTVELQDAYGNVETNLSTPITLSLASGPAGAVLGGTLTVNAQAGIATFANLSISEPGEFSLRATASNVSIATSNVFTIIPVASRLSFISQPTTETAGAGGAGLVLALTDSFGNVVTSDDSDVTLSIAAGPAGATLGGTVTVAADNGVATFGNVLLDISGSYTLTASAGGLTPATSEPITVTPAAAASMLIVQEPTSGTAGAAISPEVTVEVLDRFGNLATGYNADITFGLATSPSGAVLAGTDTSDVNNGLATFNDLVFVTAGGYTLAATSGDLPTVDTSSFTIGAAEPSQLAFVQQPSGGLTDEPISPAITVAVEDKFGNVVTTDHSAVSLSLNSAPPGGLLGGTDTESAVDGVATFNNVTLSLGGAYQLGAADGSLNAAASSQFDMSATPYKLAFIQQPASGVAGAELEPAFEVAIEDAAGNIVTTDDSSVTLSIRIGPSGAFMTGTTTVSAVDGIAMFNSIVLSEAGSYKLKAEDGTLGVAKCVSFAVTSPPPDTGVTLSIVADDGNWSAYAQVGTDSAGLADMAIDVIGSGGLDVTSSFVDLPNAENTIIADDESANPDVPTYPAGVNPTAGFVLYVSNGDGDSYSLVDPVPDSAGDGGFDYTAVPTGGNGIGIIASQQILTISGGDVIDGVGQSSGSKYGLDFSTPLLIAHGTYSGTSGTLTVVPDTTIGAGIQTLEIVSNGQWQGPGNVQLANVISGQAVVG
ncbi:MAG TPA: hypothetical protein VL992_07445 [Tepidisphaeraceae bacterium]|nr:hypothetical protein [Tepidisphaeraceae bacterium]